MSRVPKPSSAKAKAPAPKSSAKAKAAPKLSAKVDVALQDWVNMYCVSEYLPKLQKLGIKTVQDFKELSEADIRSLKMNRFDEKRFMQGLKLSVPEFLIYSQSSNATGGTGQMNEGNEVEEWLEKHQLGDYAKRVGSLGVRTMDDIRELDEQDMKSLKLNKF